MDKIKKVFYLPGTSGNIWATYENYLKTECEKLDIDITFVDFPKEDKCNYDEWEKVMKKYLKPNPVNMDTVIISRCFGSRFIVKYVVLNNIKIKGLVCIATTFENKLLVPREYIQKVLPFFQVDEDIISKAIDNIENRIFIYGDQDHLFAKEWLEKTAKEMKAEKIFIPGLNHCGNNSGKKDFPEVIDALREIDLR